MSISARVTPLARAVLIALGGILTLTVMDAVAKQLVTGDLNLIQVMALRSLFVVMAFLLLIRLRSAPHKILPTRWRPQLLRAAVGIIAPLGFFASLRYLPLTNATVIAYNSVFVTSILSALILKERVGPWRWAAIAVGYIGVAVALEPTGAGSTIGYTLVLVASVSYSALAISGKWMGDTESSSSLVLTYNSMLGLVCLALLPWFWQTMSLASVAMVALFAMMAVAGQLMLTEAYRRLDGSLVAPLEYTSLVWAVLLDVMIWSTTPTVRTLGGATIIILASLLVLHRERLNARLHTRR